MGERLIPISIPQQCLMSLHSSVKKLLEVLQDETDIVPTPKPLTPSSMRLNSSTRAPTGPLTDDHRRIRMRLSPLLSMEATLTQKLLPEYFNPDRSCQEICVRANSGWKTILQRATSPVPMPHSNGQSRRPGTSDGRHKDDPTAVLAACKDDIVALWYDPIVRDVLNKHNVRLEDSPGLWVRLLIISSQF